jgi:cytochrome P450
VKDSSATSSPLPPGPAGPALWNLLHYMLRPEHFFRRARERWGSTFSARFTGLGTFVFLGDPAAIKDVFKGDPEVLRTGEANAFAAPTLGPGSILTLDGEEHARQRRALAPLFLGERMKAHLPVMRQLCLDEISRWREGTPVALEESCREITLQAILRLVFGMKQDARLDALAALVRRVMHLLGDPLAFLAPALPERLARFTQVAEVARLQKDIDEALLKLAEARRAEGDTRADFLGGLLEMRHPSGEPLSARELRDHLYTALLAGHDTTAIALAWAFGDILDRPEVLARIRTELQEVVGPAELAVEHLDRLVYLDAVIKESLRLHPLVDFSVRLLKAPFTAAGVTYPAGVTLAPCTLLAHMRAENFPEPEAFRPERFLSGRPDPHAYIPFGGGVRRCLGMAFALFEMRVVLATMLHRVTFAPQPGRNARIQRRGLFLAPSDRATFTPTSLSG